MIESKKQSPIFTQMAWNEMKMEHTQMTNKKLIDMQWIERMNKWLNAWMNEWKNDMKWNGMD